MTTLRATRRKGIITERGIAQASEESILELYPEFVASLPSPE